MLDVDVPIDSSSKTAAQVDDENDDLMDDDQEHQSLDGGSTNQSASSRVSKKSREQLNSIEKQRTKRINNQIVSLRNLLEVSNIPTKKDKFSVLKNIHDYVIKLRQGLMVAEDRLGKLSRQTKSIFSGDMDQGGANKHSEKGNNRHQDIIYESLFTNSFAAMALTGVDGQFINCNDAFSNLSGYSKQEIKTVSMFSLTLPEEMNQLFSVVGNMLSYPNQNTKHFWKKCKFRNKDETCFVSMWLIRQDDGEPTYFQMIMVPLAECSGAVGVPLMPVSMPQQVAMQPQSNNTVPMGSVWSMPTTKMPSAAALGQSFLASAMQPRFPNGMPAGSPGGFKLADQESSDEQFLRHQIQLQQQQHSLQQQLQQQHLLHNLQQQMLWGAGSMGPSSEQQLGNKIDEKGISKSDISYESV